jgi:hypothetical protein
MTWTLGVILFVIGGLLGSIAELLREKRKRRQK